MPRTKSPHPTYCHHKQSDRGYATVDGKQKLFPGAYNSAESRAAYDALISQWLGNGRQMPAEPVAGVTVSTVTLAFWKHAQAFYRHPDGTPTGEAGNYRPALRALRRLYGATAAASFGPNALRALRSAMLIPGTDTDPKTGKTTDRPGWSRTYANRQVDRIKAIFRWAASREMIPASIPAALATVDAVRAGRDGARETEPVAPVADELVDATLPHLPPPVAAMVRLQRLTAARGGELFKLRACDIDMSGTVWKYRPTTHKTAHKGHRRTIRFGPQAREILRPFLTPDLTAYLFRPADAIAWRNERRRSKSIDNARPRKVRSHYTKDTYARAVARACDLAFAPPPHLARQRVAANGRKKHRAETRDEWRQRLGPEAWAELQAWRRQHRWHPHQLRHSAGTVYRREGDFEVAKIMMGHQTDSMTQHYAERDERKADEVVARIG